MSAFILWAGAFVVLLVLLVITWWRNTAVRKSLSLSDEVVQMMTTLEITWLLRSLTRYLATPEGATLAADPRVVARLALFEQRLQVARDRVISSRLTRALRAAGLPKLPAERNA